MSSIIESSAGFDPPVDLVHLARQCLGDPELEAELLGLFRVQARALTAELSHSSVLSLESKAKIAHKLRGSALAVGARHVASAAGRIEELASAAGDQRSAEARAVAALLSAVAEAVAEIDRLRG
jgi:HPt (histidine-containing phosphotransfer) domain-containing protein